jgi:hypothetical protein
VSTLLLLFSNKQLMYHPKNIMAYFMLIDIIGLLNANKSLNLCPNPEDPNESSINIQVFEVTAFKLFKPETAEDIAAAQIRGLIFIFYLFIDYSTTLSSSLLSIGFCYDLIQTIKNPFSPFQNRLATIFKVILASVLGLVVYILFIRSSNVPLPQFHSGNNIKNLAADMENTIILYVYPVLDLVLISEIAIGVFSIYVAFKGLFLRKG